MKPIKVTLDTVTIRYIKEQRQYTEESIQEYERLIQSGVVIENHTERVYQDTHRNKSDTDLDDVYFSQNPLPSVFRADFSRTDRDATDAHDHIESTVDDLFTIFFSGVSSLKKVRNSRIDCEHLEAHLRANNDIFITADGKLLKAEGRATAKEKYGLIIMSLEEFLAFMKGRLKS